MKILVSNQLGLDIPLEYVNNVLYGTSNEGKTELDGGISGEPYQGEQGDYETGNYDENWQYSEGEDYTPVDTQQATVVDNGAKIVEDPKGAQEDAEKKIAKVLTENPNTKNGKLQIRKLLDRLKYYLSDFGVYVDNYAKSVGNQEISNKKEGFAKAYSTAFSRAQSQRKCPNCGNTVTPVNGRCPVCGHNL